MNCELTSQSSQQSKESNHGEHGEENKNTLQEALCSNSSLSLCAPWSYPFRSLATKQRIQPRGARGREQKHPARGSLLEFVFVPVCAVVLSVPLPRNKAKNPTTGSTGKRTKTPCKRLFARIRLCPCVRRGLIRSAPSQQGKESNHGEHGEENKNTLQEALCSNSSLSLCAPWSYP